MTREALRRYARRPWSEIESAKRDYWAAEFATAGPAATLRAAYALWLHMRRVRPDWPSEAERNEDFAHHSELKRRMVRAARAFPGR